MNNLSTFISQLENIEIEKGCQDILRAENEMWYSENNYVRKLAEKFFEREINLREIEAVGYLVLLEFYRRGIKEMETKKTIESDIVMICKGRHSFRGGVDGTIAALKKYYCDNFMMSHCSTTNLVKVLLLPTAEKYFSYNDYTNILNRILFSDVILDSCRIIDIEERAIYSIIARLELMAVITFPEFNLYTKDNKII